MHILIKIKFSKNAWSEARTQVTSLEGMYSNQMSYCCFCLTIEFSRLNNLSQSTESVQFNIHAQFQSTEFPAQSTEFFPENFSSYFQSTESPAQSTEFEPANFA